METSQSQTISTLSNGISNIFRSVETLVEIQKNQTEAIDGGFERLVQVLSKQSALALPLLSPVSYEPADERFDNVNEAETLIIDEFIHTNHTSQLIECKGSHARL